jgi:hypothetical protein
MTETTLKSPTIAHLKCSLLRLLQIMRKNKPKGKPKPKPGY